MSEKEIDNQEKNLEEKDPKEQETVQDATAAEEGSQEPELSEDVNAR